MNAASLTMVVDRTMRQGPRASSRCARRCRRDPTLGPRPLALGPASGSAKREYRHASAPKAGTKVLVVGLGKTGLSCARYLHAQGCTVAVTDSREIPPGLDQLRAELPDVALMLGGFADAAFGAAEQIVVSPGVSLTEPAIQRALAAGVPVYGDVELFAHAVRAPVVGITGSNGKSTVTTLLGLMARQAGRRVGVGGNLGEPVLDILAEDVDLYVVELSSFQLETTHSLRLRAATVLNLSPDHMDRYPDIAAYAAAKGRIFAHAEAAVVNRDDRRCRPTCRRCPASVWLHAGHAGRSR